MVRLFEGKGCPHYCWCMPYRHPRSQDLDKPGRKAAVEALVTAGTPRGMVAYDGAETVAWVSIASQETFSKTRARAVQGDAGRRRRGRLDRPVVCSSGAAGGRGVTHALPEGAVEYARSSGARVVEACPWDTAGITATHVGYSTMYEAADFVPDEGRRRVERS